MQYTVWLCQQQAVGFFLKTYPVNEHNAKPPQNFCDQNFWIFWGHLQKLNPIKILHAIIPKYSIV